MPANQRRKADAADAINELMRQGLEHTITAVHRMGFDEISFLAADVSSSAFNRAVPWTGDRIDEVAATREDLRGLAEAIERAVTLQPALFENGFVTGGRASLDKILRYYGALSGARHVPRGPVQRAVGVGRPRARRRRPALLLSARLWIVR